MPRPARAQSRTQRVSLEKIAEITKISPLFLEAIVREDFDKLPGGIFDRSYIKQYAVAAGVDGEEILQRYHEHLAAKESRAAGQTPPQRRASSLRSLVDRVISA